MNPRSLRLYLAYILIRYMDESKEINYINTFGDDISQPLFNSLSIGIN